MRHPHHGPEATHDMQPWDHGGVVSYVGLGSWWGCFICRLGTMMGLFHMGPWWGCLMCSLRTMVGVSHV